MGVLTPRRLARATDPRSNYLLLAAYLWHPLPWVARCAAANPSTPRWARHLSRHQRRLLDVTLSSPDCSAATLEEYVGDTGLSSEALSFIARHPKASPDALASVAAHPNATPGVLRLVVSHVAAPAGLVEELIISGAHPKRGHPLPMPARLQLWKAACERPDLSPAALAWLVRHCDDQRVLAKIASHPNASPDDAVFAALAVHAV